MLVTTNPDVAYEENFQDDSLMKHSEVLKVDLIVRNDENPL